MKVKRLVVQRFRGIREMDWITDGSTICLVGPGDSTKTTVLDALEWVLSPRWSVPVSDADFHGTATADPIVIEATVSEIPPALLSQQKFGLEQRGWGADGLHDEPEDDDEPVITIRLTIDDSLEPRWEVVNDRTVDPRIISARDRESLGVTRLGAEVERHLTWGRGSALLRLTDSTDEMGRTLAEAHRTTRGVVSAAELGDLKEAAERAASIAKAMGAGVTSKYTPGLDPTAIGVGAGSLGLHDGGIPVRAAGLGSRRLAALGIQRASFSEGGIVLIDEVETGLEPHRLRHLIRELKASETGQVIMTTHSEVAIVELTVADLRVVASEAGTTVARKVGNQLQAPVRAAPEALLGRRVIVGEGKTEVGLCRALDETWTSTYGKPPAEVGTVLVPGGGTAASATAMAFASLGYTTALLVDSDADLDPAEEVIVDSGVALFMWPGGVCTEERVMADLPIDTVMALVDRASELVDEDAPNAVRDAVTSRLGAKQGTDPAEWTAFAESDVRRAVAITAKKQSWFKGISPGEALGALVVDALPRIPDSELARTLTALGAWAYGA